MKNPNPPSSAAKRSSLRQNGDSVRTHRDIGPSSATAASLTRPAAAGKIRRARGYTGARSAVGPGSGELMRKLWWPEPLYEMKPYAALALGLLAVLIGSARSWATQAWDAAFLAVLGFAVASTAYAVAVLRMRHEYRRRSRWNRERRR